MATLDKLARQQNPYGMTIVSGGEDPKGFAKKLDELQSEIHHLQWACTRLQRANRASASRYVKGSDIRVVSDDLIKELGILQGWLLSAVETYFALVWMEMGSQEMDAVAAEWKKII